MILTFGKRKWWLDFERDGFSFLRPIVGGVVLACGGRVRTSELRAAG